MPPNYTPEFKKKIVRLREEEGRSIKSITAEFGVSKATISKWCSEFSKEWQSNPISKDEYDNMKEILKLKKEIEELKIEEIYHNHNGVAGYRQMTKYLADKGYIYSFTTIHKYMNKELGLHSIVRPKKLKYKPEKVYQIFDNKLKRNFIADEANQKWCTDFTYLYLANHDVRYNCTILDLYRRNVVASITEKHMTSNLAIRTLQKVLDEHPDVKGGLILHSDRGLHFTSKAFIEFCQSIQITQSMSQAGCPYDNAPIERYFNTLKNECTNLYDFQTEDDLYKAVEEFSYVTCNYLQPHTFNKYQPPCRIV